MFKVLFKTASPEDVDHVRDIILARHGDSNGDEIIVSSVDVAADIVINVPPIQKKSALIFDHSGSIHRLGYPDDIEYDDLIGKNDGMKAAPKAAKQEKAEKLPKECPQCHYMKQAGIYVCPKCGFKPLTGEDVETDATRGLKRLNRKAKTYSKNEKQAWWSQIKYYQHQRILKGKPLSDGWAAHTYKEKFGTWPKGLSDYPMETSPEVWNFIKSKFIAYSKGSGASQ